MKKLTQIENSPDVAKILRQIDEPVPAPKALKPALITGIVLCILSVVVGTMLIALNIDKTDPSFESTQFNYILLFFLPVPLIVIALAVFSTARNYDVKLVPFCAVAVSTFMALLIFGLSTFYVGGLYKHDYGYVTQIEQAIGIDLPDSGTISTQDYNDSIDKFGLAIVKFSGVKFTDKAQADAFRNTALNTPDVWKIPEINPDKAEYVKYFLPQALEMNISENTRFLIFNVADGIFNSLPNKMGECDLIVIEYNSELDTLRIWEIRYTVLEYERKTVLEPDYPAMTEIAFG